MHLTYGDVITSGGPLRKTYHRADRTLPYTMTCRISWQIINELARSASLSRRNTISYNLWYSVSHMLARGPWLLKDVATHHVCDTRIQVLRIGNREEGDGRETMANRTVKAACPPLTGRVTHNVRFVDIAVCHDPSAEAMPSYWYTPPPVLPVGSTRRACRGRSCRCSG